MKVYNTYAKIPYWYNRYEYAELSREELRGALYENAYKTNNRHTRLETVGNKNGKGITYPRIYCGFDCETYTDVEQEKAYMYIWQFGINKNVIRGRTYEEFLSFLDDIKEVLQPKDNHRLLVLDQNMGYEFSYFKGWLNLDDASQNFLKDKRTPLKLTHDHFVEFRDSMALFGGASLASIAKDYCNTQKCVNDLCYNIPRNRFTVLDEQENMYVDNDVLCLVDLAEYIMNNIMTQYTKLPLTQTGLLANESKYALNDMYKNLTAWHRNNVERSPKNEATYTVQANYLYRGGFTHANVSYVDQILDGDLLGVDITSSYPYVMTQPVFAKMFSEVQPADADRVDEDIKNGLVSIFIASFKDIKSTGLHSIESKHKCLELSPTALIDNGRVYEAHGYEDKDGNEHPAMVVYLTSFDWQNYKHYYDFNREDVKITAYQVSETRYLYKHIGCPMLRRYKSKAYKKEAGENYTEDKVRVNTYYGYLVKRMNDCLTKYDNNGFSEEDAKSYEEQLASSITCFYDGVFVSAVARWRLLSLCWDVWEKFGIKGIYADTDSWKFLDPPDTLIEYLGQLNQQITADNVKNIEYFTEYDKAYADLGCWDVEYYPARLLDPASKKSYIIRFESLGAKRYIIEADIYNKKTQKRERALLQTVAGLPKGEMLAQYGTIDRCFEEFSDKMHITGCKLYSHYVDTPYEITVTDEQGHTDTHVELSCNALMPCDFNLTIDEIWKMFYTEIAEEELKNGNEHRLL